MKADPNGTRAEQARSRMGWMTATQARIAGIRADRRCSNCRSRFLKEGSRGDGGLIVSSRCGHIEAGGIDGHATRENCACRRWERKP